MEMENGRMKFDSTMECRVGSFSMSWDLSELDDFFLEKARTELRETPEIKPEAFKQLRLLLQEEPDLHVPDDDEFLQMFLRPCKWYPKSAFQLIKRNYRFKMTHPRVCNNLLPSTEEKGFSAGLLIPMPTRTKSGCRVVLISGGTNWKPKEVSAENIFRVVMMGLQAAIEEERTQVCGLHVIIDLDGFSLSHVTALSPSIAAMIAEWVQKCQPSRLKGIHLVNQPFIFNVGFALFKPFILEKTRKRIHFHGKDRASLLKHLDAASVPTFLGGDFLMPDEPVGPAIWRCFCQSDYLYEQAGKYGYKKGEEGIETSNYWFK